MSTNTLAPWDQAKFQKLKASIADEADVRARLASWDATLIENTKELAAAKAALTASTKARDTKYQSLRALLATESATAIKSHLNELFVLDDEVESHGRLIREINSRGMSSVDRDNLIRRLDAIAMIKNDIVNFSPLRREIREQQAEIREFGEGGNAAKRLQLQVEAAKTSHFDNRDELVAHYTFLLERHNRKLAAMQANLEALLKRVFA